jgi:hypothetical protein
MPQRTRGQDCASDLILDRWRAGELSVEEVARLETHLAACARCQDRRAALTKSEDAFDPSPPAWLGAAATRSGRLRRWPAAATAGLALAAGVLLFVTLRRTPEELVPRGERLKGSSARIGFHVKHDGAIREGVPGDRLAPRDTIQLAYSTTEPGYLVVLSVDGAAHASVYHPRGPTAAPIAAGREIALTDSVLLDDTLGAETLHALFCRTPIAVEPVRAALEREPHAAPSVAGCTVDTVRFEKVAR